MVDHALGMAKTRKRPDAASTTTQQTIEPANGANGDRFQNGGARDRIAQRAYELYLARGGTHGGDFDDWIAAERELTTPDTASGSDRNE